MKCLRRWLGLAVGAPLRHWRPTALDVERAEWAYYVRHLREGMVVFDVGAFIGELTLLFSRFVGLRGVVHAFEAMSANYRHLAAVCGAAGRTNVILNRLALADREGSVRLSVYGAPYASWSSLADRPLPSYGIDVRPAGAEVVPCTTVDAYCEAHGIRQIRSLED